jgi:hypothetical protein
LSEGRFNQQQHRNTTHVQNGFQGKPPCKIK